MSICTPQQRNYPLTAVVGQADMVLALKLLAVDPGLGGLLLVGEKGTAKSTAARALAEILPPLAADPHLPAPFKTVPLGITEDRLLGGLDWEKTITLGQPEIKPGLLLEAHQGLLYIDEINLLEPTLAHLLLDAAGAGRVVLERDGLSAVYTVRAALLATMNPEEGPFGPQLADRFALTVNMAGESNLTHRVEIIKRRLAFERDPEAFRANYAEATAALKRQVAVARRTLPALSLSTAALGFIADLAAKEKMAGHRGDLALARAALAWAALTDQTGVFEIGLPAVMAVAHLVLTGRRGRGRKDEKVHTVKAEEIVRLEKSDPLEQADFFVAGGPEVPPEYNGLPQTQEEPAVLNIFKAAEAFKVITPEHKRDRGVKDKAGRRQGRDTLKARGRAIRTTSRRLGRPLSLSATLRAAAPYQQSRRLSGESANVKLLLNPSDFREKVYRQRTGRLVVFVVDSSGSVGTLYRMQEAKAAAISLLTEAYQKRDRVALVAFYGQEAQLLLPPTNSPDLAGRLLSELPSGGKTPLAAALVLTQKLLRVERAKDPHISPYIVLMTDGRPNIPLDPSNNPWREVLHLAALMAQDPALRFLLIDTDRGAYNEYKLTHDLAERLSAPRVTLEALKNGDFAQWLKSV